MARRRVVSLVAGGLLALAAILVAMSGAAMAITPSFTAGQDGTPTSGDMTDLKGRSADVSFAFVTDATLTCDTSSNATSFTFHLGYTITGPSLSLSATT